MQKGWFKIPGVQDGDRTIAQQMKGLARLCEYSQDKTILDLGCAEGLVGIELTRRHGAARVDGLSLVKSEIEAGRELVKLHQAPVNLHTANLNDVRLEEWSDDGVLLKQYDAVIMLAILHKLKEPAEFLHAALMHAGDLVVIRTAERTPGYIQDTRSGERRFDVQTMMTLQGWRLDEHVRGPFNEWTGYFVRA